MSLHKRQNKKRDKSAGVSASKSNLPVNESDPLIGKRIGVYELKKELGRGGMGVVYLAERADGEFNQKVAVKFIKRGMDTDFIVRSFRKERQILANLEHPFIARLLDGGTSGKGLPYLVMEFVEGKPLYQYCDMQKFDIRRRLQIFQQICSAVSYAHEHKIIHRDLKPGNIIVTDSGNPKLLDFGIAKMLDPDVLHESINPTTHEKMMTFDYASPEQICGGEATVASDIYSLGVLLYELLTGHNPYKMENRSPYEISRLVCEEMPELPSRIVGENANLLPLYAANKITAEKAAQLRQTDIENLAGELAGNLDLIIIKALAKLPEERFHSVKELSDDIERYLSGKDVLAKPITKTEEIFTKTPFERTTGGNSKSIAVLPLKFLNPVKDKTADDQFLGLGLADALITRLSYVQRFIVRPTGSILRFGETQSDSFTAGRELGVEYILDGNIIKAGERLRISVQLLKVADKSTIWAERFDEKIADVLQLEDVISNRVAESLIPRLTAEEREGLAKRCTDNPKAFEMYMRGRAFWSGFTPEGFTKAIESHEKAIALDANYALAYAGLADNYNWLGVYGILPPFECFQKAKELSLKAIEIDEEVSDAHAALGFAVVAGDYDWARGESENRRALELNPNNATAHVWYSLQLFMEGRFSEGEYHARRGAELDPLTPYNVYNIAWCLYYARRYRESIAHYHKTIAAFPTYPLAFYGLSWTSRIVGDYQTAIEAAQKTVGLSGETQFNLTMLAQTHAAAGEAKIAREILANLKAESAEKFVSPYHLALIYCFLGEKENALEELEKSLAGKEAWIVWMGVEPVFDVLHAEERFLNLLETTGNPNLQRIKAAAYKTPETSATKKDETDDLQQTETNEIFSAPVSETRNNVAYIAAIIGVLLLALSFAVYYFSAG